MTVKVYSLPNCPQCRATERKLDKLGVPYDHEDLSADPVKAAEFRDQGYLQAPIVVTTNGVWGGYRPDLLGGLIAERRAA